MDQLKHHLDLGCSAETSLIVALKDCLYFDRASQMVTRYSELWPEVILSIKILVTTLVASVQSNTALDQLSPWDKGCFPSDNGQSI